MGSVLGSCQERYLWYIAIVYIIIFQCHFQHVGHSRHPDCSVSQWVNSCAEVLTHKQIEMVLQTMLGFAQTVICM